MTIPALATGPVYLDYNATTPVDPAVTEALVAQLVRFGNPSSDYSYGTGARQSLDRARDQVAALIGARGTEVTFTGSGSEANNLALRGAVLASGVGQVVTQPTEHPSVLATCRALERLHGVPVTYLPVDHQGLVNPGDLAAALASAPGPALVSIMSANNETGALQPVADLTKVTHEHGGLFHCDAAQTVGKIPVDVTALEVDLLTLVGHKVYAPKGIGALYVRSGTAVEPLVYGGGQERGLRAGTENVAFAVALGAAAQLAAAELAAGNPRRLRALRDRLHAGLADRLPGRVLLNGPASAEQRLPHTLNVSIPGVLGAELLQAVPGLAASTGSACHSGTHEPSPVLTAMGYDRGRSLAALRLSVGRWTSEHDVDEAARLLAAAAT